MRLSYLVCENCRLTIRFMLNNSWWLSQVSLVLEPFTTCLNILVFLFISLYGNFFGSYVSETGFMVTPFFPTTSVQTDIITFHCSCDYKLHHFKDLSDYVELWTDMISEHEPMLLYRRAAKHCSLPSVCEWVNGRVWVFIG